jgi:predicted  nucleic acid-binding Zn-ribbon protein
MVGDVAEAKAKMLERRATAAAAAGGASIGEWNRDLLSLSIELEELHVRVESLEMRLAKLRKGIESLEKMLQAQAKLPELEIRVKEAKYSLDVNRQNATENQLPKVTIISSEDSQKE